MKLTVAAPATLIQNSQLLKFIPETLNEIFTFIIFLQIAFTILYINLLLHSGRISAEKNFNFLVPQKVENDKKLIFFFLTIKRIIVIYIYTFFSPRILHKYLILYFLYNPDFKLYIIYFLMLSHYFLKQVCYKL